jgi:hypothetical protein
MRKLVRITAAAAAVGATLCVTTAVMLTLSLLSDDERTSATDPLASSKKSAADSMIASELMSLQNTYKNIIRDEDEDTPRTYRVDKIPDCEQCSDLERLLILERVVSTTHTLWRNEHYKKYYSNFEIYYDPIPSEIIGASSIAMKNSEAAIRKLRDAEARYTEKFNIAVPWWWVCSIEERVRRLENAVKTGIGYPYYPVTEDSGHYETGKIMAAYEMWFKRPLPECTITQYSEQERLKLAEQALEVVLPYRSKQEDAELKDKLKAEYKRKFKQPIPDYWLSVERINYSYRIYGAGDYNVSVTRTASGGAVAKTVSAYVYGSLIYSLKLSMEDWLTFINTLDKLGVSYWEIKDKPFYGGGHIGDLKIFTSNNDTGNLDGYCVGNVTIHEINANRHVLPYNWKKLHKLIDDMKTRIDEESERQQDPWKIVDYIRPSDGLWLAPCILTATLILSGAALVIIKKLRKSSGKSIV